MYAESDETNFRMHKSLSAANNTCSFEKAKLSKIAKP